MLATRERGLGLLATQKSVSAVFTEVRSISFTLSVCAFQNDKGLFCTHLAV